MARCISGRDAVTGTPLRVTIEGGRIAELARGDEAAAWLSPGFIDLQVNGFAGGDFNGPELQPQTVARIARALAVTGVTRFVPTLITAPEDRIHASLRAIAAARAADPVLRRAIPYVHLEGPHISAEDGPRGAHPAAHVRPPDLVEFERWQAGSSNLVGMVTLSPHFASACDYISALAGRGVHVALGHTHALPSQVDAAVEAGASLSTHLGNGVAGVLPRHPNLLWTQLADDRLTASFIADGFHLPGAALKAMVRAKGIERSILVSDSVALAGLPPGIYDSPIGGRVELTAAGRLGMLGTPFLAGAARPLCDGVAEAVNQAGLSLAEAVTMVTRNPARFIGEAGILCPGAPANLVRFHWRPGDRLRIDSVLLEGTEVSDAGAAYGG